MTSYILWDFDNTLGYKEGMFSGSLMDILNEALPEHNIKVEQIKHSLSSGFPWHEPEKAHVHMNLPEIWWKYVEGIFARAYVEAGLPQNQAENLAKLAHEHYIKPSNFTLYNETIEVLAYFKKQGWKHIILSNHVPELPKIVEYLGLGEYIEECISSANIGFEKPYSEAYKYALNKIPSYEQIWMVGDSYIADVKGAEDMGINAIQVRGMRNELSKLYAADLWGVVQIIENEKNKK